MRVFFQSLRAALGRINEVKLRNVFISRDQSGEASVSLIFLGSLIDSFLDWLLLKPVF